MWFANGRQLPSEWVVGDVLPEGGELVGTLLDCRKFVRDDVDEAARAWLLNESEHGRECFRVIRDFPTSPKVLSALRKNPGVIATMTGRVAKYFLQAAFFNGIAVPPAVLRPFLAPDFVGARYALVLAPAAVILPELWEAGTSAKLASAAGKVLAWHLRFDAESVEAAFFEKPGLVQRLVFTRPAEPDPDLAEEIDGAVANARRQGLPLPAGWAGVRMMRDMLRMNAKSLPGDPQSQHAWMIVEALFRTLEVRVIEATPAAAFEPAIFKSFKFRKQQLFAVCAEAFLDGAEHVLDVMTSTVSAGIDAELARRVCQRVLSGKNFGKAQEDFLRSAAEFADIDVSSLTSRLFTQFMPWMPLVIVKRDPDAFAAAVLSAIRNPPSPLSTMPQEALPHESGIFGLKNEGTTCFVNASLQQVLQIAPLESELLDIEGPIPKWLLASFAQRRAGVVTERNALEVLDALSIPRGVQGDAPEFISLLFDVLDAPSDSVRIEIANILKSETGDELSRTRQKAWLLDLPLAETMAECVAMLLEPQTISDYYSDAAGQNVTARRTSRVTRLGDFLFVQLHRFDWDGGAGVRVKRGEPVDVGLEFDFGVALETCESSPYEVVGLIEHYGTAEAGHYLSVLKVGTRWVWANDSHIEFISEDSVKRRCRQAYVLLYRRKGFVEPESSGVVPEGARERARTVAFFTALTSEAMGEAVLAADRADLTVAYITRVLPLTSHVKLSVQFEQRCSGLSAEPAAFECSWLQVAVESCPNEDVADAVSRMFAVLLAGQERETQIEAGNFALNRIAALRTDARVINRYSRLLLEFDADPVFLGDFVKDAYARNTPAGAEFATAVDLSPILLRLASLGAWAVEPLRHVSFRVMCSRAHSSVGLEIIDLLGQSGAFLDVYVGECPGFWLLSLSWQLRVIATRGFNVRSALWISDQLPDAAIARSRPEIFLAGMTVKDAEVNLVFAPLLQSAFGLKVFAATGRNLWRGRGDEDVPPKDRPEVSDPGLRVPFEFAEDLAKVWRTFLDALR